MPRTIPADYFSEAPFTRTGPLAFQTYTCVSCSQRLKTWEHFKAHRRVCTGELARKQVLAAGPPRPPRPRSAPLSEEDMGALAELLDRADEGAA